MISWIEMSFKNLAFSNNNSPVFTGNQSSNKTCRSQSNIPKWWLKLPRISTVVIFLQTLGMTTCGFYKISTLGKVGKLGIVDIFFLRFPTFPTFPTIIKIKSSG